MSGHWSPGIRHMDGNQYPVDGWRDLILSPKRLFPGSVSVPCLTKLASDVPNSEGTVMGASGEKRDDNSLLNREHKFEEHENGLSNGVGTDNLVVKSGGSIAERRAAKFGFDALKISTSRFKASNALASPAARSPYLLSTPGLSPSALLESPVMLPNLQPSPTTGAFALPPMGPDNRMVNSAAFKEEKDKGSDHTSAFTFKPHSESISLPCYSATQNQSLGVEDDFQCSGTTQPPVTGGFEFPTQLPSEATVTNSEFGSRPDSNISSDMFVKANSAEFQPKCSIGAAGTEVQQNSESNQGEDTGLDQTFDGDQKVLNFTGGTFSTSEDGYNWRKYGQKHVKGSEFPRSYFKCTHPSCPVKKKVEHSHDGQITEIVYKGAHNHPRPQPNRRSTFSSAASCGDSSDDSHGGGSAKAEGGAVWRNLQHECNDLKLGSDRRPENLERTCSTSIATDVSDPSPATEGKSMGVLESAGTPELSSTLAGNDDEEEDAATQGSMQVDDEDIEPDLKRRKMEEGPLMETALGSRAVREPRVIVQIESEVDILDDGYRWRKYGQKVVKGNPNPRSYYKCTHPGCTVRKHVERASHNLKCVLTTYEGKHNHGVPTARNSTHTSSGGGNSAPSLPHSQAALSFPRNSHLSKSEPQDLVPCSNRKVEYNKDFLSPNYLGNFAVGASSIYQMKFPTLPNSMLYGAHGENPNNENPQATMIPTAPGLSIPPPMGFAFSPNLAVPNHENQRRTLGLDPSWDSNQKRAMPKFSGLCRTRD